MKYRAALFDLDGTLLDTLEDLGESMNAALASMGYPPRTPDDHRLFVGDGFTVYAQRALPPGAREDPALVKSCVDKALAVYSTRLTQKTHLYDGIAGLLDSMAGRGMTMAVFSNKPHQALVQIMAHYFGRWTFVAARGAQPSAPRKPDPSVALEIAKAAGIEPREWIYLGDTNTDMETALRAGMFAVGVLWGFRSREELVASGAQALVARPAEILDLL
jgi:phosphoglycolate phosphatase